MICKIQVTINAHTGIFSFSGNKSDLYDRTNPDWAPSLKLGPQKEESQSATLSSKKRYERIRKRHEQDKIYDCPSTVGLTVTTK